MHHASLRASATGSHDGVTPPFARLRYTVGTRRAIARMARSLRGSAARAGTPAEAIAGLLAEPQDPVNVRPTQVESELRDFLDLVTGVHAKRILEIGTGVGGTLYLLAWASAPGARVLSLDIGMYPPERRRLYRTFAAGKRVVDAWLADSHLEETRDAVRAWFGGEPLDVLFIDGDHTYDSVRRDHELYAPLVRPGGIVAFHDIVEGPYDAVGEAPRFWREVRSSLDDPVELVESWEQGGFGIGVGRRRSG